MIKRKRIEKLHVLLKGEKIYYSVEIEDHDQKSRMLEKVQKSIASLLDSYDPARVFFKKPDQYHYWVENVKFAFFYHQINNLELLRSNQAQTELYTNLHSAMRKLKRKMRIKKLLITYNGETLKVTTQRK